MRVHHYPHTHTAPVAQLTERLMTHICIAIVMSMHELPKQHMTWMIQEQVFLAPATCSCWGNPRGGAAAWAPMWLCGCCPSARHGPLNRAEISGDEFFVFFSIVFIICCVDNISCVWKEPGVLCCALYSPPHFKWKFHFTPMKMRGNRIYGSGYLLQPSDHFHCLFYLHSNCPHSLLMHCLSCTDKHYNTDFWVSCRWGGGGGGSTR